MNFKKAAIISLLAITSHVSFAQKKKIAVVTAPLSAEQIDSKVEELLKQMTLEEKVGQMTQITLDVLGKGNSRFESFEPFALDVEKLKKALIDYKIGSILNT